MTALELRQNYVAWAEKYNKIFKGSKGHKQILDVYNSIKPLPRGYKMTVNDAWCACFVSAIGQMSGLVPAVIIPECSCNEMIKLYKRAGLWVEADSYTPQIGDLIFYSWKDTGAGDCTQPADHVGIVAYVKGDDIDVIEGNKNNAVGHRAMKVDGKYIRGYAVPDYQAKSNTAAPWAAESWANATARKLVDGTRPGDPATRQEVIEILNRLGLI